MIQHQPTVSIIIPAYNAATTLIKCIDSVIHQSYPKDKIEIIVINDGSNDNSQELLTSTKLPNFVKIHMHNTNKGLASTRNTGIKNSQGEIIIFLDADMEVQPDFIKKHVIFHNKPDVTGVVSALEPDRHNPMDKYQKYLYWSKRGAKKNLPNHPLPYYLFIFGITSIKRTALVGLKIFDESITSYGGEDTEFAYRLWQKYPNGLFYAPDIKVIHHHFRRFDDALTNIRIFGKNVVPYLIQKHPEFDRLYGYSYIRSLPGKRHSLKRIVGSILKSKIIYHLLKFAYKISPYPCSNGITRLILASVLWQGIAASSRKTEPQRG